MTGKERFLKTLRFAEPDRPPHFESMFELEHEAFGLRFPDRNSWAHCSAREKAEKIAVCLACYERIVETYRWDALAVYWPWADPDGVAAAKRRFGERIAIGGITASTTWSIESISDWMDFSVRLAEDPQSLHAEAERRCRATEAWIDRMVAVGADFIFLANDVAHNGGPFIRPVQFAEFVTPYLARQVARIRERGAIAIFHSDGNLMPVLDQILACQPHVLMSLDPMAGMDLAEVKRRTYGRMALMGNVQCNLMQEGPRAAIRASARYCLEHGAPGGGYIFSTSNTIFPGMPLAHYEYMLEVFREFCAERSGGAACQCGSGCSGR